MTTSPQSAGEDEELAQLRQYEENRAKWSALERLTAPVTLRLLRPSGAAEAMALVGFTWTPLAFSLTDQSQSPGLYAWVDGDPAGEGPATERGVLYWGIGIGADGANGRIRREIGYVKDGDHGHGIAMRLRKASAVVSQVALDPDHDLSVLLSALSQWQQNKALPLIQNWLREDGQVAAKAEHLGIRLSIHLG